MGEASRSAPEKRTSGSRAELTSRLKHLEGELEEVRKRLWALGPGTLPGVHLVVEAAGRRALVSASRVTEVVRLVAFSPLAGAPPHVRGTFVYGGVPVVAIDLRSLFGAREDPDLDAQIVILSGTPALGLLVDRVSHLLEDPELYAGHAGAGMPDGFGESGLSFGLCACGGAVLPVLDPGAIAARLSGRTA